MQRTIPAANSAPPCVRASMVRRLLIRTSIRSSSARASGDVRPATAAAGGCPNGSAAAADADAGRCPDNSVAAADGVAVTEDSGW